MVTGANANKIKINFIDLKGKMLEFLSGEKLPGLEALKD